MEQEKRELKQEVITYASAETKGGTYPRTVIKDENGRKFTIWHKKQNGEHTKAFIQIGAVNLDDKIGISYDEEEKTFVPQDGDKKGTEVKYMSRRIAFLSDVPADVEIKPEFKFNNTTQESYDKPVNTEPTEEQKKEALDAIPF